MTERSASRRAGPILHLRGHDAAGLRLAAIVIRPEHEACGPLRIDGNDHQPRRIATLEGLAVWRFDFRLAPGAPGYEFEGESFPVETELSDNLRLGFLSCNGEEIGDLDRDPAERDAMWERMRALHDERPFAVLIQGGDQIYADEVTQGHPLSDGWPEDLPRRAPTEEDLEDLAAHLRAGFVRRYMRGLSSPAVAALMGRVPTLAVWDDHDICDGWGSLPEKATDSAVGRTLFRVAREMYLLFQHGAVEAEVAEIFVDPTGGNLGWERTLPGVTLRAPDLRSERRRRRVMGEAGWSLLERPAPEAERMFLVSSVPLLGPRLSLVEAVMWVWPGMQKYEDDLRDQWQSRAHREDWKRALRAVIGLREAGPVTALSGEIHLATRAEMAAAPGPVHQLVASGIAHRAPPKGYARGLGWLGSLGEGPLSGHPIRILPLPGMRRRYVAERNFLVLERTGGAWSAVWQLEESGPTPPLAI
ncbi:alkaline phosphatase D family protein [Limimaricola variabilis]|uniref:alkaline phosphatase D family protein n=1 Tax=Limimaricola variabilis TaxID=1492771 RepID=UPI002AC928A4|nr:alkaline phosphatase D family protein [Limimaricola variabilis]WPY95579.1 alkaline phosphatase D family protein [Limimaricola variabilis]